MMNSSQETTLRETQILETDSRLLTTDVVRSCLDAKGIDVAVLEVSSLFQLADYFVVVSGRSDRHVQGIVNRIVENLGLQGQEPSSIEGYETGHWVVLDIGNVVVHVFYQQTRETYDLESLWSKAKRLSVCREDASGELALRAA